MFEIPACGLKRGFGGTSGVVFVGGAVVMRGAVTRMFVFRGESVFFVPHCGICNVLEEMR